MADASDDDAVRTAVLARDLRVVLGAMRRRLRAEGHLSDFTPSQLAVLSRLERDGPATVTSLAQAEGVRTQSMGATVSVLENSGFVQGAAHPTDGRQTLLSLTPAADGPGTLRSTRPGNGCSSPTSAVDGSRLSPSATASPPSAPS